MGYDTSTDSGPRLRPEQGRKHPLWTIHGDGRHLSPTEVVAPEERLAWSRTIGIGMQHVVAMFGATFVVPLLTGFPPITTIFFSGVGTLVFILATRGRGQRLGLPSYTGSSFAFISPVLAAKADGGIAVALGGIFCAGALLFVIGLLVDRYGSRWINVLMPSVVTGAVVALIGLNLAPSAWNEVKAMPGTALITLTTIVLATVLLRGFLGRISILLGVVVGYLVAWPQGQLHLAANWDAAKWFGAPPFHTPIFQARAIGLIVPVGADLAGTVRAGGPGAARFAPGDAVFGQLLIPPLGSAGTHAQYVAVGQDAPLARIPVGLDPVTAAALPTAGVTALQITESLARAGVTGVNFALSMTVPRLDRLAARVAAGSIVPPPTTQISLDDVPAVLENPTHPEGKTVITM